jgi:hypothetical protein
VTTPKGFHDADVWLQVEGKVRPVSTWDINNGAQPGSYKVEGIKVVQMTQSRPNPPRKGCIATKITLRIPDGAFLPFAPEAVITVPQDMTITAPIEVTVEDPNEENQ